MDIQLWPLYPGGQIINRIDAHQSDEYSQKKDQSSILDIRRENHAFISLHFCHM